MFGFFDLSSVWGIKQFYFCSIGPAVRKLMEEYSVSVKDITGSGPQKRLTKAWVLIVADIPSVACATSHLSVLFSCSGSKLNTTLFYLFLLDQKMKLRLKYCFFLPSAILSVCLWHQSQFLTSVFAKISGRPAMLMTWNLFNVNIWIKDALKNNNARPEIST